MAKFEDHISQAKRNLKFLSGINRKVGDCFDWQVTTCFYVGVHLINAKLAKHNLFYRSHEDVMAAINPESAFAIGKVSEDVYVSFKRLRNLSRRSRYLLHDDSRQRDSENACMTYERHLRKAVKCTDKIIDYVVNEYEVSFDKEHLFLSEMNFKSLNWFESV